jgi:hypothetical protein
MVVGAAVTAALAFEDDTVGCNGGRSKCRKRKIDKKERMRCS